MVQAIEENSVRRGYDPRDFTLVAFGGGGPLYACDIAQELEHPAGRRAAAPGHHVGDGPARDERRLRLREDEDGAAARSRSRSARSRLRRARGARRPRSWSGTASRASQPCSSDRPTAATSARATSCGSRCRRGRSTPPGSSGRARPSTSSTSGATTAATTTPRSSSSTSTRSGWGRCLSWRSHLSRRRRAPNPRRR